MLPLLCSLFAAAAAFLVPSTKVGPLVSAIYLGINTFPNRLSIQGYIDQRKQEAPIGHWGKSGMITEHDLRHFVGWGRLDDKYGGCR